MTSLSTPLVTGFRQSITVSDVAKQYRNIISASVPSQGKIQHLSANTYSLTNYFKTVDCDNLKSIKQLKIYSLQIKSTNECVDSVQCMSDLLEVNELASDTSLNGRYLARLKSAEPKKQFLEIWEQDKLLRSIDVSELDVHGLINTDGCFSQFVWSPFGDQDKLLYVCESKHSKSQPFFKEKRENEQENTNRGEEFLQRADWGESLVGIQHPIVAVLDVASGCRITTIEVDDHSLGSPQWIDNGSKIVSVAYKENPRRLGILHCYNRASKIMVHDWKSSNQDLIFQLESDTECLHSPRVNNAGTKFLYMKNPVHGAHAHAVRLYIYDLITRTNIPLTDEMFIVNLPRSCFTSDDKHILLVQADHLHHHMCLFSLETKKPSKIKFPTPGLSLMDFRNDIILASGNGPNTTPTLFVAKLCLSNISDVVAWHQIEDCIHLDEIDFETYQIPAPDQSSLLSALLVKPDQQCTQKTLLRQKTDDDGLPTVVLVHGGPNSAYHVCYSPESVLYAKLGMQTLYINYRGSTGVSEEYVESLNGLVGVRDVQDCLHVIRHFVQEKLIDPTKLIIKGGSHGGFLSCHLSCQNEFRFTSAIIINPVVDIATLQSTSDIQDWGYTVALGRKSFDFTSVPSSEDLVKLYECSPILKVKKANVPTLMLLGSQDRRVPMFQGERWVDILRARGVETLCKIYPDGHSLAKPEHATDAMITTVIWMLNHLPK